MSLRPTRANVRSLATASVFAAALLVSGAALAETGTVTTKTGESINGEVMDFASGDHITMKLPGGQVKAIAWSNIGSFQIGAGGTIVIGGGTAAPPPPPPTYAAPPPPTYTPAPPPPAYAPAPQPVVYNVMPPNRYEFYPTWTFGLRVGWQVPGSNLAGGEVQPTTGIKSESYPMRDYVNSGLSLEADVGFRFMPHWTVYGYWEHTFLGKPTFQSSYVPRPSSELVGIGFIANTNPGRPFGMLFDVSTGYRWMQYTTESTLGQQAWLAHGWEVLRLGVGMEFAGNRNFAVDLMLVGSAGVFTSNGAVDCTTCGLNDRDKGWHTFLGATVGGRWEL